MVNQEQYDHRALTKYNFVFLITFPLQNPVNLSDSRASLRLMVPPAQGLDAGPSRAGLRKLVRLEQSLGCWSLQSRA